MFEEAVESIDPDEDYDGLLVIAKVRLGNALRMKFERTGSIEHLVTCIGLHEKALMSTPIVAAERPMIQSNLGAALHQRFERFYNREDLTRAHYILQETLDSLPTNEFTKRGIIVNNLGNVLRSCTQETTSTALLDRAINSFKVVLSSLPPEDSSRHIIKMSLGNAFSCRYKFNNSVEDLNNAILVYDEALSYVDSTDDYYTRAIIASNLSAALRDRFERNDNQDDINRAAKVLEDLVPLIHRDDHYFVSIIQALGDALSSRAQRTEVVADLEQAIAYYEEVLRYCLEDTILLVEEY